MEYSEYKKKILNSNETYEIKWTGEIQDLILINNNLECIDRKYYDSLEHNNK